MKPTWNEAPEDATHLAQDGDGLWLWYVGKPVESPNGDWWMPCRGGAWYSDGICGPVDDWRNTLEARPKDTKP